MPARLLDANSPYGIWLYLSRLEIQNDLLHVNRPT